MGSPAVQVQEDPLVGSMDGLVSTNTGTCPVGGVAVMAMRSRSPTPDWRCKSPVKPQQPSHMVACAVPTTPTGKHHYLQVALTPRPGAAAGFKHQQAQEQAHLQAQHQAQLQAQQQQAQGRAPPPPPLDTVPPTPPCSLVGSEADILATPRSAAADWRAGGSQEVRATENSEEGAGRRTPPRLPGIDFLAKLGDRVNFLEASMEQIKLGEEPSQQQAALRENILDAVKSTALEALSHSFNQQAVQLHARMTNLHDSVLSSLEKGMQEAEGRLQGLVAEMCAQANRGGISAECAESTGTRELREMLEAERQDPSDLAERQSDVIHGLIQEFTAFKAGADSRSQELEQLRTEVEVLRASDAARQSRLQEVVDAFGESLQGEREAREARELGDAELRGAVSALQASAQQAPSSDQGIHAPMAEELQAFGRRMDASEARLQQLAEESVRQACDTAAGAITRCQEFATQLESERSQRASEVARFGAELASGLGAARDAACAEAARLRAELEGTAWALREAARSELDEAMRRAESLHVDAKASAEVALAEGLADLRGAVGALQRQGLSEGGDLRQDLSALRASVCAVEAKYDEVRCSMSDALSKCDLLAATTSQYQESDAAIGVEVSALRAEMDALAQTVCELRPRPEAESAELQAREEMAASLREEMSTTLREELQGAEERSLVVTGALQEFCALRDLVKAWKPEPPPPADALSREGGTDEGTTPTGAGELARELVAAEQQARCTAIAEVQEEVAALQESLCHLKPDAHSGETDEAPATGGPTAEALELAARLKAETEARHSSIQELREELSAERIAGFVQQAGEEASERLEARASDAVAALEGSAEQQCAKLGEVISELLESAEKRLEDKLSSCAGGGGGGPGAGAQGGDLDALLQRVEAQEKEHATGLQELGELFLGELAGLRASTDEQCRLLLQELQGERETRSREFTEFREALCSPNA